MSLRPVSVQSDVNILHVFVEVSTSGPRPQHVSDQPGQTDRQRDTSVRWIVQDRRLIHVVEDQDWTEV